VGPGGVQHGAFFDVGITGGPGFELVLFEDVLPEDGVVDRVQQPVVGAFLEVGQRTKDRLVLLVRKKVLRHKKNIYPIKE
jgi:hypothetical protein